MVAFGERLKYLRKKCNLSQEDVAKTIGISKSSISMYERGEREPDFETLEAIANNFNVDMNFLLGKSDCLSDERISLGDLIKKFRSEHGIIQDDFAERSGLSKAYISILERNSNPSTDRPAVPSMETIKAVSNAMGINFKDVVSVLYSNDYCQPPENDNVHNKIMYLRKLHGLTLEEVGNAVGVGKSTGRKWECGDIESMRVDKMASLAAVLKTTPDFLMDWNEENSGNAIGKHIKVTRKKLGISAEHLAEIAGVSPGTIYRYENGSIEKIPSSVLSKIAVALQTTPDNITSDRNNTFLNLSLPKSESKIPFPISDTNLGRLINNFSSLNPEFQNYFLDQLDSLLELQRKFEKK